MNFRNFFRTFFYRTYPDDFFRMIKSIRRKQPLADVLKIDVLETFAILTGKHLHQSLSFYKVAVVDWNFIKKETLA